MTRTPTQPGTLDHRAMWKDITTAHTERFSGKRVPMVIMANYRTLNMLIGGDAQSSYFLYDKIVLKTSLGDLYFRPHKAHDDGELTFL